MSPKTHRVPPRPIHKKTRVSANQNYRNKYLARRIARVGLRAATRTFTKTRTQNKTKQQNIPDPMGNMTKSMIRYPAGKQYLPKSIDKLTGDQVYTYNYGQLFSASGVGVQSHPLFTGGDGVPIWASSSDLIDIMRQANTMSATSFNQNSIKIYMKELRGELMLYNPSNTPCKAQLYDCVARHDITDDNKATPGDAWTTGAAEITQPTNMNSTVIGSTPFQCGLFTRLWKVIKVTDVYLPAGSTHVHKVVYNIRKVLSNELVAMYSTGSAQRNLTCGTLINYYGLPFVSGNTVTTGSAELGAIWKKQYIYKEILQNNLIYLL